MDRQISYNGPLTPSPLPCNFPGSRSPTLKKHPLPPKPPISMYFHAYTPLSPQPKTALRDMAARHVEHGKSIPVNNGQNRPFANHHATASSNGVSSSPHADSVIRPSGEVNLPGPGSVTGHENDRDETSSINSDDLLHPDELFSRIWKRSDDESCEASLAHKTVDNGSETSSATSKVRGIGVPGERHPNVADDGRNDPPAAPIDRPELHRDSTPSLGTCDEADTEPSPPEAGFTCAIASPSPSPDLLGSQHPQAGPGPETIMRDEFVVDDTKAAPESCEGKAGNRTDVVTTIQSAQINRPLVGDAGLDNDERRLAKESQAPVLSRLRQRTRLVKQPKGTLASTRSLRRRPNTESTRSERLPAVSVVIPTCRTDELAASTRANSPTRARRLNRRGGSDSFNVDNNRGTQAVTGGDSPLSGGSSPKARGRPRTRPKRAIENTSASTNDIVGTCTSLSQALLNGGLAVTLGETQEIFGRGILRIQTHGPRHAYFMTFLPEAPDRASMISPFKMPPDSSLTISLRIHPRDKCHTKDVVGELGQQHVRMEICR
ncbi:hypothetical protein AtubIFM55763_001118 [Aspergillus tubingensis]|nr:hypothetical protein AtubIFM55763_001118 [Aspergillus tubingensis]